MTMADGGMADGGTEHSDKKQGMRHQGGRVQTCTLMATCRPCGDVVVSVSETLIWRSAAAGPGWYAFGCPGCGRLTKVEATTHLLAVLDCLGAVEDVFGGELFGQPAGPPLTMTEVLDLTIDLHATDDLVGLALGADRPS
jgi:hypothetical protein